MKKHVKFLFVFGKKPSSYARVDFLQQGNVFLIQVANCHKVSVFEDYKVANIVTVVLVGAKAPLLFLDK